MEVTIDRFAVMVSTAMLDMQENHDDQPIEVDRWMEVLLEELKSIEEGELIKVKDLVKFG